MLMSSRTQTTAKFGPMIRYFSTNKIMKNALYAGSFDPPSSGHLDIITRALNLCDTLTIGVALNPMKTPIFQYEERKAMLKKITSKHNGRIKVTCVDGLLADFIEENKIDF